MNTQADRLLTEAKGDLARGEEFYRTAADKIIEALRADPTISQRDVAARLGRDQSWVQRLVAWRTSDSRTNQTPFAEERGSVAERHARSVARNRPEAIVDAIRQAPETQRREILEGILRSPELDSDVGYAAAKTTREIRDDNTARDKERSPETHRLRSQLDAQAEVAKMDHAGLAALRYLQQVDDEEIQELDRELLLWRLRRIDVTVDWMIERLTTGARSVDDELAELLNEEV